MSFSNHCQMCRHFIGEYNQIQTAEDYTYAHLTAISDSANFCACGARQDFLRRIIYWCPNIYPNKTNQ